MHCGVSSGFFVGTYVLRSDGCAYLPRAFLLDPGQSCSEERGEYTLELIQYDDGPSVCRHCPVATSVFSLDVQRMFTFVLSMEDSLASEFWAVGLTGQHTSKRKNPIGYFGIQDRMDEPVSCDIS
jgi:hypothetical protein